MSVSISIDDTICAISTLSAGSISIIRISGADSINVLKKVFLCKSREFESHRIYYGHIWDEEDGETIDEVLVSVMLAPKTYTKEDVVEINCHGGLTTERVLEMVLKSGVRLAEPGEFTKRAFLNGRIDLSQAEAVIDIISSKSEHSRRIALNQLEGGISKKIRIIRTKLLEIISNIEANIDYPENELSSLERDEIENVIQNLIMEINFMLRSTNIGKILKDGIDTIILGKPNVGKSTLLNSILKEERAIVSEIPGTTRDVIIELFNMDGIPLRIIDTAGIRETEEIVEKIGIDKTISYLKSSDLVLAVVDISCPLTNDDYVLFNLIREHEKKLIIIANKMDIVDKADFIELYNYAAPEFVIDISAKNADGIEKIYEAIKQMFLKNFNSFTLKEDSVISNARHKELLVNSQSSLYNSLTTIESGLPDDLLFIDLSDAYKFLGKVIGEEIEDDVVDKIFADFCVGK